MENEPVMMGQKDYSEPLEIEIPEQILFQDLRDQKTKMTLNWHK